MLRIGGDRKAGLVAATTRELPSLTNALGDRRPLRPAWRARFLTEDDIETLFGVEYEVHFNSARTGVRLIGPSRNGRAADGGEAGLHPSNIHDNAYAVGAIDFTGDMPIILGPDGPSLGGSSARGGRPGRALEDRAAQARRQSALPRRADRAARALKTECAVAYSRRAVPQGECSAISIDEDRSIVYRRAGDDNILVEYGPMVARSRAPPARAPADAGAQASKLPGILDLTPGIRSLQVHYDNET